MRGTAPLLVTVLGAVFLRELPRPHVIAGILLISIGIIGIAFARRERHPPAAAWWAFANAAIIAVYTLVDGTGARASGNALSYVLWLTFIEGIVFLTWIRRRRGGLAIVYVRSQWRRGLAGGAAASPPTHRAVGDDARTGCRGRRAARDVGAVRRADRRGMAEGRLHAAPPCRGGQRCTGHRRVEALMVIP
jgi:hypothetical protein